MIKKYEIIHEFNFSCTPMDTYEERWARAEKDIHIFQMWEIGKLNGRDARFNLARQNNWPITPSLSEFKEIAARLGYFRGDVPEDRKAFSEGDAN